MKHGKEEGRRGRNKKEQPLLLASSAVVRSSLFFFLLFLFFSLGLSLSLSLLSRNLFFPRVFLEPFSPLLLCYFSFLVFNEYKNT